ncbi:glycoside hydrolase family 16 protein [Rhodococcus marinonascens]|uniref:glycoside hydrolase family 16 protein n=1 Tax=Rhodococcus marinonascens TaxID=38311 RepID=UPI0009322D81|nr:glycoside hydrolase family 16 protein [Rhodococcus marinonascens]
MSKSLNRPGTSRLVSTLLVFIALACIGVAGWYVGSEMAQASENGESVHMFDDFSGPAGARPDPRYWGYDLGGGGWGNDEQQVYTDDRANSRLDGEGHLVIEARSAGAEYTSARLVTLNRFAFQYGRAEARIKLPSGQGLHPAFWLMGTDLERVGWPQSGEIDVIETLNDAPFYHSGLHGPSADGTTWEVQAEGPGNMSEDFHNYWVEKSADRITVGIDDSVTGEFLRADLSPGQEWVFDKPFSLLLNVAVGGRWPGPVDSGTSFPATMLVDWVEVTGE